MLNTVYRLIAPRRFEAAFQNIELEKDTILVRPEYLSICHADQRYFQGVRSPEVLRKKLPMALIHEGIGRVVYDSTGEFQRGQRVIMIPNIPVEEDEVIGENYLPSSRFCSSGYDGFMRDYVSLPRSRFLPVSEEVPANVAAFMELTSVSYHAVQRMEHLSHGRRERIGVWGDGNLGYITALLLKTMHPEREIVIMGVNQEKLSSFTFADEVYVVDDIPEDFYVDHGFECVGGIYSERAINQIIDVIKPEGTIGILGVSETRVGINTRMILEKGLRLFGSSRSGREDFAGVLKLLESEPSLNRCLETLVHSVLEINDIQDIAKAFEYDQQKQMGKTILRWNI
ncbi:MAG: alcohol dehydrogenase catalytic domain-containing protein [Clostridium sp.]|nr:alcohol dehydrogenase catalytic domain-containing protein [Clostridium sp.]